MVDQFAANIVRVKYFEDGSRSGYEIRVHSRNVIGGASFSSFVNSSLN